MTYLFIIYRPVCLAVGQNRRHGVSGAFVGEIYVPLERCSCVHLLRPAMAWWLQPGRPTTLITALQFYVYSCLTTIVTDAKLQWLFLFQLDRVCNYANVMYLLFIRSIFDEEKKSFKINQAWPTRHAWMIWWKWFEKWWMFRCTIFI